MIDLNVQDYLAGLTQVADRSGLDDIYKIESQLEELADFWEGRGEETLSEKYRQELCILLQWKEDNIDLYLS